MRAPLYVAMMWHMHQPDYRCPHTGEILLPWVRLHATRAYFDMAWLLDRHPKIRATFNFVPILTEQLEDFIEAGKRDHFWHLTLKPAQSLDDDERAFILDHFFSCAWDTCIKSRPRYWSLLTKRGRDKPYCAPSVMGVQEMRDLQVLFNLAWFGFAAHREYPWLDELEAKGQGYTEEDKQRLVDLQIEVMGRTLPLYRRLAERNQIELTTTPYDHPILPLVFDSEFAGRAMPDAKLPRRFSWPQDAAVHVDTAISAHTKIFGQPPTGMWPAEGSVCPEVVPLFERAGIRWIATDEAQLWGSLNDESADRYALFRPYRIEIGKAGVNAVFRDHELSDLIGFTYSRNEANVGVGDLVNRLETLWADAPSGDEPLLVSIILDGENPWEHYPDSGFPFLDLLYTTLEKSETLQTVTIGAHLEAHPPTDTLRHLHSGSWIMGNYGIWCGGEIENTAWGVLGDARHLFEQKRHEVAPEIAQQAHRHLLTAQGSDWFWWYGDNFSSENDRHFDRLFRGHLARVYELMGESVPARVVDSLYPATAATAVTRPRSFISPRFDAEHSTYFDWAGAGEMKLSGPSTSMYRSAQHVRRLRYGFDLAILYLQIELDDPKRLAPLVGLSLRVFVRTEQTRCVDIPLGAIDRTTLRVTDPPDDSTRSLPLVRFAHGVVELGVPLARLGLERAQTARLSLHLLRDEVELERHPETGHLEFETPGEHFEEENWSV